MAVCPGVIGAGDVEGWKGCKDEWVWYLVKQGEKRIGTGCNFRKMPAIVS